MYARYDVSKGGGRGGGLVVVVGHGGGGTGRDVMWLPLRGVFCSLAHSNCVPSDDDDADEERLHVESKSPRFSRTHQHQLTRPTRLSTRQQQQQQNNNKAGSSRGMMSTGGEGHGRKDDPTTTTTREGGTVDWFAIVVLLCVFTVIAPHN